MELSLYIIAFLVSFIAAIPGTIFGGGSFITLPVLFLLGVNPKIAIATNFASSLFQWISSGSVFYRYKKIHLPVLKWLIPPYLIGAIIGSFILIEINAELIKQIVAIAILVFAAASLFRENHLQEFKDVKRWRKITGFLIAIAIGVYSVLITAGNTTILIFMMAYLFGFRFKKAVETRPAITPPAIIVGSVILAVNGLIDYTLLMPLALGRLLGAFIGANLVLKLRSKWVRVIFNAVAITLSIYILLNGYAF